ncbi:MAG: 50S ribosomal protein L29 [Deltaproteobacteria bacterium]|nr:MAG: 50S ribosomal protein L29 [Deltaproteobacteria bacterium]
MDLKELRAMTAEELRQKADELREDLARLTMKRYARRLEKPSELRRTKKELARVLTLAREKELEARRGA